MMNHSTRRFIFYAFVTIFIIATPPTILYAMGYSFDWQKRVLVPSGGFYFKSLPIGSNILINNQNQKITPRLITRLAPKTYSVSVGKNNFSVWQKELEIKPGLVTEARNIVLFPKTISPEKISANVTSTIPDFLASPEKKRNQALAQKIASSSAGWLNKNSDVLYIDSFNFVFYRQDFSGFIKEQLAKEPLPKENYKIFASTANRFLTLSSAGDLFLLDKDTGLFNQIHNQAKDAQFSSDNKKILILSTNEIWVFYIEDILIQPYKKAGEIELITRFSQPISQAIFCPDNEHIAFVVGDQIKITELDGRDQRNNVDFVSVTAPQIYFDEPNSYFYYLTQNELFRVKLDF